MKPRIGITTDADGEYLKLKREYVNAVTDAGGLPLILAPTVEGAGIADSVDAILFPGGDDVPPEYYGESLSVPSGILKPIEKTRIDFEMSLLKEMMKRQKPILGICYGMQMVNVALGGSLYQDIGIQVKPVFVGHKQGGALNHKQGRHEVKITAQSPITFHQSRFLVNSSHHQAVKNLAHELEAFALAEDGIIEGFYHRDYPFLICVQWHPERGLGDIKGTDVEKYKELSSSIFKSFIDKAKKTANA